MKLIYLTFFFLILSTAGFSQVKTKQDTSKLDTTQYYIKRYKLLQKVDIKKTGIDSINKSGKHSYKMVRKPLYRPTRLGSSSPLYDTYKKNNYGAGAVTTNPHKSGRSFIYESLTHYLDSLETEVKDSIPPKKD